MTPDDETWIAGALQGLGDAYARSGMRFQVNPPPELVPPFLGGYRPDAIALGPDGGVVIEVTERRSPEDDRRLADLARKVSEHEGWEFRAIHARPPAEPPALIPAPTRSQLLARFEEAEALAQGGHESAALLTGWSALEALGRLASSREETPRRALTSLGALQALAEQGYLDAETFARLRAGVRLRNAIAHGDLSVRASAEDVTSLLRTLRAVADRIATVREAAE